MSEAGAEQPRRAPGRPASCPAPALNENEIVAVMRAAEQYRPEHLQFRLTLQSGLAKLAQQGTMLRTQRAQAERRQKPSV